MRENWSAVVGTYKLCIGNSVETVIPNTNTIDAAVS